MNCPLRFTKDDAERAWQEWGFNCGPGALCAILNLTPHELRPLLGDFEAKRYTNPTLMWKILMRCAVAFGIRFDQVYRADDPVGKTTLKYGLLRVQWGGRWTNPGVPMRARYRHTHWVGVRNMTEFFDVNAMEWLPFTVWNDQLVPWLCHAVVPGWDGTWWPTHAIEVRGETEGGTQ